MLKVTGKVNTAAGHTCWHRTLSTPEERHSDTRQLPQPRQALLWNAAVSSRLSQPKQYIHATTIRGLYGFTATPPLIRRHLSKKATSKTARRRILTHCTSNTAHNCPPLASKELKGKLVATVKQNTWNYHTQPQDWIHTDQDWEMHCSSRRVLFARLIKSANAKQGDEKSHRHFTPLPAATKQASAHS